MAGIRLLAVWIAIASCAAAQAPLFQVLDNPVPQSSASIDAIGDLDGDGDGDAATALSL